MRTARANGHPRILFPDAIARSSNVGAGETIEATTPGHQSLPFYEGACLGAVDLTRFVRHPFVASARFDQAAFASVSAAAVELLDRALDVTAWPLPQQAAAAAAKRGIGMGFSGLGDAMRMLGLRADTPEAIAFAAAVARTMREAAYRASAQLAARLGAFPLFDATAMARTGTLASTLPSDIQHLVRRHGIRNARLLSFALADMPRRACAQEQLALLAAMAPHADGSMSTTIDVAEDLALDAFKDLHLQAWHLGLPGCAIRTLRTARADSSRT
jgi:ribonucleoside-diphosphate reductase alpha chain